MLPESVFVSAGLLADEESQPLLRAMAAIRSYPAAGVASEAALFWRILHESNDMAAAWARDLRLNDASNLVGGCFPHRLSMHLVCPFFPPSGDTICLPMLLLNWVFHECLDIHAAALGTTPRAPHRPSPWSAATLTG